MKRKTLLLLLALPPILLLVADLGFRFLAPPGDFPELKARFVNDFPGYKREVQWTSDSDGLRKIGWEDGRPRVLCFGGENTTPVLQADADTWWGVAATVLANESKPIAIGALSNPGQPTSTNLGWVRHFAKKVKPQVVVLSFGAGEVLFQPVGYRFDENAKPAEVSLLPGGWKGAVLNVSAIARHWRLNVQKRKVEEKHLPFTQENALRNRFIDECKHWQSAPTIPELPWINDPSDEIAITIKTFAAMGKELGFRPVVLWEPWPHRAEMPASASAGFRRLSFVQVDGKPMAVKVDPQWVDHRLRAFHTRAQAICQGMGIGFVDGAGSLNGREGLFFDDALLNDEGARAVGTLAAPVLRQTIEAP